MMASAPVCVEHVARFLRRVDVAVGDHRNRHRRLDRGDGVVFGVAACTASARVRPCTVSIAMPASSAIRAMFSAFLFSRSQPVRIFSVTGTSTAPTTASTIRATSASSCSSAEPAPDVADLLGRAAHVDVDDLRAVLDVVARALRPAWLRIGAGDLHGDRLRLRRRGSCGAAVFSRRPQTRVGRRHLRHRIARAQRLHSWRNGRSVTPAMGATKTLLRRK